MKERFLEAGRIVNTVGIRGEVKLEPWCDSAEFLRPFRTLYIDGTAKAVASSRVQKGMLVLRFADVADINAAMPLKGKVVFFDREDPHVPAGTVFVSDILGAEVINDDGTSVGKLTEVLDMPAGKVYMVNGNEHSIPVVPEFVKEVDPDNGIIRVHLIEGM